MIKVVCNYCTKHFAVMPYTEDDGHIAFEDGSPFIWDSRFNEWIAVCLICRPTVRKAMETYRR